MTIAWEGCRGLEGVWAHGGWGGRCGWGQEGSGMELLDDAHTSHTLGSAQLRINRRRLSQSKQTQSQTNRQTRFASSSSIFRSRKIHPAAYLHKHTDTNTNTNTRRSVLKGSGKIDFPALPYVNSMCAVHHSTQHSERYVRVFLLLCIHKKVQCVSICSVITN